MRTMKIKKILVLITLAALISSCGSTISVFDQYAYSQTTSLKVDGLRLMDKATSSYASQKEAIDNYMAAIDKIYEYELHRPKNEISAAMWRIIKDPEKNLLGGFMKRWEARSSFSSDFIGEMKRQVGEAFDLVIDLESKKIKPGDAKIQNFIK